MNEILLTKVETHNVIKDTLLDLINSQPSGPNDNTNDKANANNTNKNIYSIILKSTINNLE